MRTQPSVRLRFGAVAAITILSGCGSLQYPAAVPPGPPAPSASHVERSRSWMGAEASGQDLLYVSDPGIGAVFVYTYKPSGMKFVGLLTEPTVPGAECVDKAQNVWILSAPQTGSYAALEYAHGGTSPIAMVVDPAGYPVGCSVDPTNGNLAIASLPTPPGDPTVAIFKKARGKPTLYADASVPSFYYCAYDNKGNLFLNGTVDINQNLILAELPKGASSFQAVSLGRQFQGNGGLQWDGKYLAVGELRTGTIYRYAITASGATNVGSTPLDGVDYLLQYFIDGNRVIAPNAYTGPSGFVSIFKYPEGGKRIRTRPFSSPVAVVVSRAPKV